MPYIKYHKLPLLPFERQLIEIAGISEEEYRFFVAEALKKGTLRPAEYDLVPDVRNDVVSVLVSIAIGAVLQAAAYFLTPKPRAPRAPDQVRQRQLASRTGADVFAPTSGFDSLATLATYGEPIPLLFGRYTGSTGGMVISPKLVWSRAFSWGLEQSVKLMFVVSEQGVGTAGIERPDLQGIFLGNTPLDAAFDHKFAFYWRSGTFNGTSRIKAFNLRFGTRGSADSGDPETSDDVFVAPTRQNLSDPAFCTSYTPSSNVQFGVHSPVYNATDFRLNFKLVPIPSLENTEDDPENQLLLERIKIAGDYGFDITNVDNRKRVKNEGQRGVGRAYSRRMGITAINGAGTNSPTEVRRVLKGDTCTFTISGTRLPENFYYFKGRENVKVADINNEIDSQCSAADNILQLGETIQIGYTIWTVIARELPIWEKGRTQNITLRCVEVLGFGGESRQVGLVSRNTLEQHVLGDDATLVSISYYPLMRTQIGVVRNTRPCDATEIGLKSQVWNRANGLCNFASIPTAEEFKRAEGNRVSLNSGTMTLYFKRTSAFALQLRPAGTDGSGNEFAWRDIGISFCVTSEQPIDIYNFLRITHPERRQYEFRFVPRPGADTIRHFGATTDALWQLNAKQTSGASSLLSRSFNTDYGQFTVYATGQIVPVGAVEFNQEMTTDPTVTGGNPVTLNIPTAASIVGWNPSNQGFEVTVLRQAFMWEVLGSYNSYNLNQRVSNEITYNIGGRTIRIRWSGTLVANTGSSFFPANAFPRLWFELGYEIVDGSQTGNWAVGEQFDINEDLDANNPLRGSLPGVRREGESTGVFFGPRLRVDGLKQTVSNPSLSAGRLFERNSQLADVSFYSQLLQKSNESQPEHVISYVNEITANAITPNYTNMVTAGLSLKASRTYSSLDQIRVWKDDGMPVVRFHPDEAGSIGPSNLFCDLVYYLLTDPVAGAGASINAAQIKTADFAATARFLRTNRLFFDGAITDPSNIREYITQLAPFFLCNFVIADGLFSLVPALPTTPSGVISTDAVPISALFTGGNILEGSFSVEYINSEERNNIQAVLRYRQGTKNQLPEERTLTVRWNEANATAHKVESFDMTQYCTSRDHALLVGKYLLSVRRRITHTVKFKTTPQGLSLAPGKFIRVITQASPYSGANNGVIGDDGTITSATPLSNGSYSIIYYKPPADAVATGTLTVSNGVTSQSALFGSVFTVTTSSTSSNVYMVEQLSLDEEGMVEIVASEFPTDSGYRSSIAQDVLSGSAFSTEG